MWAAPADSPLSGGRNFELSLSHKLIPPQGSEGVTRLWVPLPADTDFQRVRRISFDGNYQKAYITSNNAYEAKTLYAEWAGAKDQPELTIALEIFTQDWEPERNGLLKDYRAPAVIRYPKEVEPYLLATEHIKLDGIVKQTADKIIGRESDPLKKARLIYEWVSANMTRDESVTGCGQGDVKTLLESGRLFGKCTDINSVFVALARAAGLPAREMFGIRLGQAVKMGPYTKTALGSADADGLAKVSRGQHCRAMFYLADFGWVPVDPADVTKMRLAENKDHRDPGVQAVNDYLFGNWEMNWAGFNFGRDFDLDPEPEQTPLNNFGYPYAEVDGDPLDYYDPEVFSYEYVSRELKADAPDKK
ncbi:MAG: transglutaminase domain-containing protein [Candidatus Adiutrix sp.]|nr:transglutaminase domain-containing protein [Candidatus Adiutrix sp.]